MRMEKLDFTCRWLGKRACENGKDTNLHANKGNKHAKQKISKSTCQRKKEWTRKMRKTRNCVSGKRGADTQKRENKKLRVAEKDGQTREKEKMRNCVSRKRKADTRNRKKENLRVGEKECGHAKKRK